jgi:hypothetical protein
VSEGARNLDTQERTRQSPRARVKRSAWPSGRCPHVVAIRGACVCVCACGRIQHSLSHTPSPHLGSRIRPPEPEPAKKNAAAYKLHRGSRPGRRLRRRGFCTRRGVPAGSPRTSFHRRSGSVSRRTRASSWCYVRPRNAVEPTLQVSKCTADARDVVAELANAKVTLATQPATELSGHVAMIQHRGPFAVAELACRSGRTDRLGESIPLAVGGSLACTARVCAIDF